jgi:hypothetical protein
MADSRVSYTSTTGTGPFSYGAIALLTDAVVPEQDQLVVTVNGTALTYKASAPGAAEYTLNKTTRNVTLGTALISSDILKIRRKTKQNGLHVTFTNNGSFNGADADLVLKQLMFLGQEAKDDAAEDVMIGFAVHSVGNNTYHIQLYAPYGYTINTFVTQAGGTAAGTAKLQIDGVDVTGSSHSFSTAETDQACTAANVVKYGNTVQVVVSGVSGSGDLDISLICTRTI